MKVLHYYTRRGCHLCEIMLEELMPLVRGRAQIELRDVDSESRWLQKYDTRVPVLEADGKCLAEYPLNREEIVAFLNDSA